jgi:carbonic anhydrase
MRRWRRLGGIAALAAGGALLALASQASDGVHWSYSGKSGPQHWSALSSDFALCGSGQNQSPIDIVDPADTDLPHLSIDYLWKLGEIVHNGHAIQLSALPGSKATVSGLELELLQFHFHTPSENRINGKSFPLEAHFVHKTTRGELAVIAVLFENADGENPSLDRILEAAPHKPGSVSAAELRLQEDDLLPRDRSYFLYSGSLTTPPCSEDVRWFVLQSPRGAAPAQVKAFAKLAGQNAREPQPLHSRLVLR